jgi:hypothetical protein
MIGDYTVTSLEQINAFDIVSGAYKWTLDELQNASLAHSEDKIDITGKQGRKITSLKRNKAVTLSAANGLISGGMLASQVGGKFESKLQEVMVPDILVVTGNKATTSYKAVGTVGNEIESIRVRDEDGRLTDTVLVQDATASAGKFAYDPATKEISFSAGEIADGTEIAVFYKRKIQAYVIENHSDKFSEKVALYIDCFGEDKCGKVYRIQIQASKADINGTFDMAMGDSQSVHNLEAELLAGTCGKGGVFWTYVVYGEDTEDAA